MDSLALQNREEEDEASVLKLAMRALKEYYGLNPGRHEKAARGIGYHLGKEVVKELPSVVAADLDTVVEELASYWNRNSIGEIFWEDRDNLLLSINNCYDCIGRGYGAGYTLCPFKEGMLAAILEAKLGKPFRVREVECCGTQAPNCVFKIDPSPGE